jgi:allantoicase
VSACVDLASRWLGGSVLAASDESFGEKENLLVPGPAAFEPGHFGHRGEIVDGWETKRRREPGHDWALVRLGAPGVITSVDVDTSFFTGNFPPECMVHGCGAEGYPSPAELVGPGTEWVELVGRTALRGDAHNLFDVAEERRFTHVRLAVFPDGGVARLRVPGHVVPDPRGLERLTVDLASQEFGGLVVESSDDFYTSAGLINRPDTARTMGEGWETQRRRDSGHDHAVIRLGFRGQVRQIIVDTAHFKYNASAEIEVYGSVSGSSSSALEPGWEALLPRTRLQPDTRHVFHVSSTGPAASVRIDAFPDGGLSRVRVIGVIDPAARRSAGYRWFNSLPAGQAMRVLLDEGLTQDVAVAVAAQRPLADPSVDEIRGLGGGTAAETLTRILHGEGG